MKKLRYGLLLSVAIGGLLLTAVPVGATQTTFPGANGSIGYSSHTVDGAQVWAMNANGTGKREIAKNARTPVWSPDGNKLVVVNTQSNKLEIMNANGTNRHELTRGDGEESAPAWSPDGTRIAFVRQEKLLFGVVKRSAVITIRTDGTREKVASDWNYSGTVASPSWASDGKRLVYEKVIGTTRQLIIQNLNNHSSRVLTNLSDDVDSNVSWSPAGDKILFNDSATEVYTIHADGSRRTVISDGESFDASWSPDGKKIAFLEDKFGSEISISGEDGTVTQIPIQKETYHSIAAPVWSPDGTKLAFTLKNDAAGTGEVSDIFMVDLARPTPETVWLGSGILKEVNWQAL